MLQACVNENASHELSKQVTSSMLLASTGRSLPPSTHPRKSNGERIQIISLRLSMGSFLSRAALMSTSDDAVCQNSPKYALGATDLVI